MKVISKAVKEDTELSRDSRVMPFINKIKVFPFMFFNTVIIREYERERERGRENCSKMTNIIYCDNDKEVLFFCTTHSLFLYCQLMCVF
jgi:hypothetical protein